MAPTNSQAHHLHAQHGDVFVPVHGGNTMPDFDSLVAAEQRELMEDDLEDAKAEANERTRLLARGPDNGQRRKSVSFGSGEQAEPHADAAENVSQEGHVDTRPNWRKPCLTW